MSKSVKKGDTKNQHFVPQFYQRYFSIDGKNIGTYVISGDKNIPSAPIKSQSSGDYFYSDNMKIEHALGRIEKLAKSVIDKIIADPKGDLTKEEQYTLYSFTMIQNGRTTARVNLVQEWKDVVLRSLMKKEVELMRNSGREEVEDITDEVLNKCSFPISLPGLSALGNQAQIINLCIDLKYKILINNTKTSFVTSDNPAAMYDQFMERMGQNYALGSRGLQIFLPLTPTIGVMYYDPKCYKLGQRKKTYVEISREEDIKELNKLTASNAENIIYYKLKSVSKDELERYAVLNKKFKPVTRVEPVPEQNISNDVILGAISISMFCGLSLSFIKELPNYKFLRPQDYNSDLHRFREIAYYKDEIIRMSSKQEQS